MHGDADGLAHPKSHNASGRVPAVVLSGVAAPHALGVFGDVVQDGTADFDGRFDLGSFAIVANFGDQFACWMIHQQNQSSVCFDPLEDQFHDALQQLVDVQGMADFQRGAVHDLQVAAGPGEPRVGGLFGIEKLTDIVRSSRVKNARFRCVRRCGHDVDTAVHFTSRGFLEVRIQHQRASNLNPITTAQ